MITSGPPGSGQSSVVEYGAYGSRPAGSIAGQKYQSSEGMAFVFDGSLWRPVLPGALGYEVPTVGVGASQFAWTNQGGATATSSGGELVMDATMATATQMRILDRAVSSPTFVDAMGYEISSCITSTGSNNYLTWGVVMTESATGKLAFMACLDNTNSDAPTTYFNMAYATDATGGGLNNVNGYVVSGPGPVFCRLEISGSNVLWQASRTRRTWKTLRTVAKSTVFTTGPDRCGIAIRPEGGATPTSAVAFQHYIDG